LCFFVRLVQWNFCCFWYGRQKHIYKEREEKFSIKFQFPCFEFLVKVNLIPRRVEYYFRSNPLTSEQNLLCFLSNCHFLCLLKINFLSHFSIASNIFVIDDEHIAVWRWRACLYHDSQPSRGKKFPTNLSLSPWRFTLQELYQIKVKINLFRIRTSEWFFYSLNVNISTMFNHH
jgi:hypothetical protein